MQLRHRFSLIALVYLVSMVSNAILATWCIVVYFNSAFTDAEDDLARQHLIQEVERLVRDQSSAVADSSPLADRERRYEADEEQIKNALSQLQEGVQPGVPANVWADLKAALEQRQRASSTFFRSAGANSDASDAVHAAFLEAIRAVRNLGDTYRDRRSSNVERARMVHQKVLMLVLANVAYCFVLCVVGLAAMRKWVIRPVAELRRAALAISQGNFAFRLKAGQNDELGALGQELNRMSETIAGMQRRSAQQERHATQQDTVNRVAAEIRNPLTEIRRLAEAASQSAAEPSHVIASQQRIIKSVDQLEEWLRDLQETVDCPDPEGVVSQASIANR